jgi:hypothetical protein
MANEIPQIQESQPILNPVHANSGAESYEHFAKILGHLSEKATEETKNIESEKSNSMYLSSLSNIDQLKLSTQELILTDPANARKHIQTMQDSIDKVMQIAYVNNEDRQKLKRYAEQSYNSTELEAVRTEVKQSQIGAAYEHYKNWPDQLDALRQSIYTNDPKNFENLKDSMLEQIASLMKAGVITPHQGAAAIDSMTEATKLAHEVHQFYNDEENHTAQNFHKVMSNPLEKNKTNNLHYPVDEETKWLTNYHASDRTFQGAQDDLQNHLRPNVEDFENFTDHQRQQLKLEMDGIREADGLINHGASILKIQNRVNELEGKTSFKSIAERKYLKSYLEDSKNGNSQKIMARTTIGGQIVRDYIDKSSYLQDKLEKTDPKNTEEIANIKSEMAKNKNDYVNNSIAYGEAHHYPIIHPIPYEDVRTVENSLSALGANPKDALDTINQYSRQNQMYLADQLKKPQHKIIIGTIAMSNKQNSDQDKMDYIAANQPGRYKGLDLKTEDKLSNDYLRNQINTNIKDAFDIISAQNSPQDAATLSEALIGSGVNYAKYLSEKHKQFTLMEDKSIFGSVANIGPATQFIKNSYVKQSGANYIINKNQVDIEPTQMDYVAQYAIDQGNTYLLSKMSSLTVQQIKDMSPLTSTVSNTNVLMAQDMYGNIIYRAPLTSDLISRATIKGKELEKEKIKERYQAFKPINKKRMLTGTEEVEQKLALKGIDNANE